MKDLRDIDYEQYVSDEVPDYVEINDELLHIETTLDLGENLIQQGPQGIGKTLSFEKVARERGIPYIPFDCSKDTKRSHLVVQTTFGIDSDGNKKVEFIPAAIPKAMIAANEYGEAMLVLEEMNALSPNMQKMVNQISDYREAIEISEAGGIIKVNEDSKLMVGATMNPSSVSSGIFDLNTDLRSRFNELNRQFPNNKKLQDILRVNGVPSKIGSNYDGVRQQIATFIESIHSHAEQNKVSYEFSPRDAVRFGKMWNGYYEKMLDMNDQGMNEETESLRRCLETAVLGKFREKGEREIIEEEIEDCFAVRTY